MAAFSEHECANCGATFKRAEGESIKQVCSNCFNKPSVKGLHPSQLQLLARLRGEGRRIDFIGEGQLRPMFEAIETELEELKSEYRRLAQRVSDLANQNKSFNI